MMILLYTKIAIKIVSIYLQYAYVTVDICNVS
jgi:hypothetical protein